jgi:hypothetical protein
MLRAGGMVVQVQVFGAVFSDMRWTSNAPACTPTLEPRPRFTHLLLGPVLSIAHQDPRRHRHSNSTRWIHSFILCAAPEHLLTFATMDVKKKHEIEAALATEAQAISAGHLKEENPLDLSDDFRAFCEACRRGDLKVCQEKISEGVNINARDKFDYTPLILVRCICPA